MLVSIYLQEICILIDGNSVHRIVHRSVYTLNPEVTNAKSDAGSIDIVLEPLKTGLQGVFFIACTQVNPNA